MPNTLNKLAPEIAQAVAADLDMKPFSNEYILSQLGKLTEETGEAFGSYLRANGFSRRRGTFQEHFEEVADVVITAYVIAASEEFDLDAEIEKKLQRVMTRGWHEKAADHSKDAPPHTHGGTDAPECTTCRPTESAHQDQS